jgi:hypothetical protein
VDFRSLVGPKGCHLCVETIVSIIGND